MKLAGNVKLGLMAAAALLAGCSYAIPYNTTVILPEKGTAKVAVATVDERAHVLNHKNPPTYVGIIRGGFGNPFNRNTDDGKPLADDFSHTLVDSLVKSGFQALAVSTQPVPDASTALKSLEQSGAAKLILVELREWQSDTMVNPTMSYDYTFHVYDAAGKELASITEAKDEDLKGGNFFNTVGSSQDIMQNFYQQKITQWFSDPKVEAALQN